MRVGVGGWQGRTVLGSVYGSDIPGRLEERYDESLLS